MSELGDDEGCVVDRCTRASIGERRYQRKPATNLATCPALVGSMEARLPTSSYDPLGHVLATRSISHFWTHLRRLMSPSPSRTEAGKSSS